MKKPSHLIVCALLAALLSVPAAAGPLPAALQFKPGDAGHAFLITGVVSFRVLEAGEGGWVRIETVPGPGIPKAERYWLNLNAALLVEPGLAEP